MISTALYLVVRSCTGRFSCDCANLKMLRHLAMVGGAGFYPDGVVLGGVSRAMVEQYAPEQLKKGLLKVPADPIMT